MSNKNKSSLAEQLNFLRSISPHNEQRHSASRSPWAGRSPRMGRMEAPPTITINTNQPHDYCPEIIGWPAPPVNPALRNDPKHQQSVNPNMLSPSPLSIKNCITAAVQTSPYGSPHHSPIPMCEIERDSSSKFLSSMLRAVASSPNSGMGPLESELRQKIQALEELVAEYERQKFNVMGTFTDYRERVAERERTLEAEYSTRIIGLSEEVLVAKKDFEMRMKSFQNLQEQFEREKEQALEMLRQEHQKEIEALEKRFSDSQLLNLEQKYMLEIHRLEEERKSLKTERERLGDTFEMKLRRAQGLYETELAAAKLLYSRELQALKDHEEALKAELAARQEEFYDRLSELQLQSKQSKDEMNNCKNEVAQLEQKLTAKDHEIQLITRELNSARRETNESLRRLSQIKADAEDARKDVACQKAQLEQKIGQLDEAESTRAKLESTVRELRCEVKVLKNRVELLEMERDNLQSQSESQSNLHDSQVQALEAMLESVTKEKEATIQHFEKLIERDRELTDEREYTIRHEFSMKLKELEVQYNSLREHIDQNNECGTGNMKLWEEIENLRSAKRTLEDDLAEASEKVKLQERVNEQSVETVQRILTNTMSVECEQQKGERIEFDDLLLMLNELEKGVEQIIVEKNEAKTKVEQLGKENRHISEEFARHMNDRAEELNEGNTSEYSDHKRMVDKSRVDDSYDAQHKLEQMSKQWQARQSELEAQIESLRKQLASRREISRHESEESSYDEAELLKQKLDEAIEKSGELQTELQSKKAQMEQFQRETSEEFRKREEAHQLELEEVIAKMNKEHGNVMRQMKLREKELATQVEEMKSTPVVEKRDDQAQTDFLELSMDDRFKRECFTPRKETRSQSLATTSDQLEMHQKDSANARFHSIMNEMDRKQKERSNKVNQQDCSAMDGTRDKDRYGQESWSIGTSSSSRASGLLSRRDRASFKLKFEPTTFSQRDSSPTSPGIRTSGLLSPTTMDLSGRRNRISPARQLFSYKSSSRPAWKY